MLLKNPGFTLVAIFTLALGIGANTAIFSIVNSLLLRPLPYSNAERLAIIWTHSPGANVAQDWPSPGQFYALKSENSVFEQLALALGDNVILTGNAEPERLGAVRASSAVFSLLGAHAMLGRVFLPEEDTPDKTPTVILSHGLWQRRFGGDPKVLGQTITINGHGYSVIGVMPPDFALGHEVMPTVGNVAQAELLLPLPLSEGWMNDHVKEVYNVLARLKPGATMAQAQTELNLTVRRLEQQFPDRYPPSRRFSFSIRPLLEQVVGDVRPALYVLLGAVGCVLLIACANVANLLLARASTREREMAIRAGLGAGRWRVVRQLLTESVLLSAVGGAVGLLLAVWGLALLRWLNPGDIPRLTAIGIDNRVLAFTTAVAVLTGILFGLVPALRSSRVNLSETLKEGGRSLVGGGRRLRNLLVVTEVALSLVLLIGAGLLIRSFIRVQHVEPGFVTQNVLSMRTALVGPAYAEEARRVSFYRQLWERIRRLPGVEAVGGVSALPLTGGIGWTSITIEGYDASSGQGMIQADTRGASAGYFETMKIPLIRGRFFADQDTKESQRVVIVDENMARTYWPNSDPIGKRLLFGPPSGADSKNLWMTVVGMVGNVKHYALDTDSRVALYTPHLQGGARSLYIVVRTTADPLGMAAAVTREARAIDPNAPIYDVKTMGQWLSESLARRRFAMISLGLFALVAMLLAAVGIYGVTSYSVAQRTREIGIRMALGAQTHSVLKLIIGQGMLLAGSGVGVGLIAAFAVTRVIASLLFGVNATDPLTFAAIALALAGVTALACWIPARRATKVDPMIAMRCE